LILFDEINNIYLIDYDIKDKPVEFELPEGGNRYSLMFLGCWLDKVDDGVNRSLEDEPLPPTLFPDDNEIRPTLLYIFLLKLNCT
jgi:hypothetical protein